MERNQPSLSVVVPVYNEAATIRPVVEAILEQELPGVAREILLVDDGSTDGSREIIRELEAQHPDAIRALLCPDNRGKGAAVRRGIAESRSDLILIQDADLELSPTEHPKLVAPLLSGEAEVVYGSRFKDGSNRHVPLATLLANRFLTLLTNLLFGGRLTDMATAYKVFPRQLVGSLELEATGFEFEPEVTAKLLMRGCRIREVPVSYRPRNTREGKKIRYRDGLIYLRTLLRCRFSRR
jgi:glycosyltransferase involved in cell wall biosynthesis